mgnify:CR=1 FL=1
MFSIQFVSFKISKPSKSRLITKSMPESLISADGKWMWNGSEWLSVSKNVDSSPVTIQDSVHQGDINITQNNVEDIKVKNQIEKLKRQSNNIAKVGIFKRFQNLFCKIG